MMDRVNNGVDNGWIEILKVEMQALFVFYLRYIVKV